MGHDRTAALPVWRLRFEEHPGLEVRVTVPTLEARAVAPKLLPLFASGRQQDVIAAASRMAGPFADSLLSWTLEWKGRPAECSRRGVLRVDPWLVLDVLREWIARWPPLTAPAEEESADAVDEDPERELLASLPMTVLAEEGDVPPAAPDLVAVS